MPCAKVINTVQVGNVVLRRVSVYTFTHAVVLECGVPKVYSWCKSDAEAVKVRNIAMQKFGADCVDIYPVHSIYKAQADYNKALVAKMFK